MATRKTMLLKTHIEAKNELDWLRTSADTSIVVIEFESIL